MKLLFIIGVAFLFISLFLEWYIYQIFDINNMLIASWEYNLFSEWNTDLALVGNDYKPESLNVPFIISSLFIIILVLSSYIVIFKDLETTPKLHQLKKFAFIFLFLLILVLFYIILFPVLYLFPNHLYFPSLSNYDNFLELTFAE